MVPSQFGSGAASTRRIALLFPGALGDFLCFAQALFALRRGATGRLVVAARPAWTALLDPSRFDSVSIDDVAVAQLFGSGDPDRARRRFGASEIYSWTGHGAPGFAERLAALADERAQVFPFRDFAPGEHAAAYYARCLGLEPAPVEIHEPSAAAQWAEDCLGRLGAPILAIHAGSGSRHKNWPGFDRAAEFWRSRRGAVVEIRGPAEEGRPLLRGAHLVVREDLPRVAALLRRCCYLGNDSGVTHLAAACRARGVALFPRGHTVHWRPLSESIRVLEASGTCTACASAVCLHTLGVDEVTRGLEALP